VNSFLSTWTFWASRTFANSQELSVNSFTLFGSCTSVSPLECTGTGQRTLRSPPYSTSRSKFSFILFALLALSSTMHPVVHSVREPHDPNGRPSPHALSSDNHPNLDTLKICSTAQGIMIYGPARTPIEAEQHLLTLVVKFSFSLEHKSKTISTTHTFPILSAKLLEDPSLERNGITKDGALSPWRKATLSAQLSLTTKFYSGNSLRSLL
jgi:hypothetical protein